MNVSGELVYNKAKFEGHILNLMLVFFVYFSLSLVFERSLITEVGDGFGYQLQSVAELDDLGVLGFLHTFRYCLLYPFILLDNKLLQPLVLFFYFGVLFFDRKGEQRYSIVLFLVFSLFFSYRTTLVMLSVHLVVTHIIYSNRSFVSLAYATFLSLLSSGAFLSVMLLLCLFRKKIIKSSFYRKCLNLFLFVVVGFMSGSFVHKILFFYDPDLYGSAAAANVSDLSSISVDDILILIANLLERGILYESYLSFNGRFWLILFFWFLMVFAVFLRRDKLSIVLFFIFVCGCFLEGLMLYSVFSSVFVLIGSKVRF